MPLIQGRLTPPFFINLKSPTIMNTKIKSLLQNIIDLPEVDRKKVISALLFTELTQKHNDKQAEKRYNHIIDELS